MMRPDAKVEKVYLYPKPVDFRKSIDGLASLVELDIKVAVFDPVLFVFLNKPRNRVKILYWERNGFCLWLKRLESERFKTSPDATDEAIVLTVQELNWMLDGFDLWRNRPHQVLTPRFVAWFGIIQGMHSMPENLPDDPQLLKQMLAKMQSRVGLLEEENALPRQRLFGRKSEQAADPATPQMALFNEAESVAEPAGEDADEEVVSPIKRRGKRKPLPADLPRIEVIHELAEHELTCVCGCRKHAIGEEVSEQLEIVPMQIRVIKHVRKVYGCRDCETAPVTADKPAQLIEKSMASPSVLAMLLTTKYVDGLPLHRFENVLGRHGIDIPRQTLARWVIQCGEHFQPLLNLMRDNLLASRVIHCDETRVQVLKEPDREPSSQSWMWVQTGGPPDKPVILFDYSTSRARDVLARLLDGYRGYLMTDDYAGYNALGAQPGVERLGCWDAGPMLVASSLKHKKCNPKARRDAQISR